jgi:hypothetical protein
MLFCRSGCAGSARANPSAPEKFRVTAKFSNAENAQV